MLHSPPLKSLELRNSSQAFFRFIYATSKPSCERDCQQNRHSSDLKVIRTQDTPLTRQGFMPCSLHDFEWHMWIAENLRVLENTTKQRKHTTVAPSISKVFATCLPIEPIPMTPMVKSLSKRYEYSDKLAQVRDACEACIAANLRSWPIIHARQYSEML